MSREYARERLQQEAPGTILSTSERAALTALIAAEKETAAEVTGEIEHSLLVYWHIQHDADDDDRGKLDKAARLGAEYLQALRDLPPHHLTTIANSDRHWALGDIARRPPLLRRRRCFLFEEHQASPVATVQHAIERSVVWARCARRRTLATKKWGLHTPELWWLLTRLVTLWTENLSRPFRPRGTRNRGSLQELAERVVAIADPEITDAHIDYVLRAIGGQNKKSERKDGI